MNTPTKTGCNVKYYTEWKTTTGWFRLPEYHRSLDKAITAAKGRTEVRILKVVTTYLLP